MSARHFFLKQTAKLHFQRISTGGKTEVQIEEAMVHRLQGKCEAEPAVGLAGSRRQGPAVSLNLTTDLRETCHRTYGHKGRVVTTPLPLWGLPYLRTANH